MCEILCFTAYYMDNKTYGYIFSESWMNKLSIGVQFVRIVQYFAEMKQFENLEFEGAKNLKKIAFKVGHQRCCSRLFLRRNLFVLMLLDIVFVWYPNDLP